MRAEYELVLAALRQEIEALKAELATLRTTGVWPIPPIVSGALSIFQPIIDTANEPGEDEAWAYLAKDDDHE